jgi:type II secretory pathway component PulF
VLLHLTVLVSALTQLGHGTTAVITTLIEGFALLYTIGFALYVLVRATWGSDTAQRFWLFLPIIGNSLATAYAYRWITALRLEFVAGVPIPDAVADAWLASGYVGSAAFAEEAEREMRSGIQLSSLVQRWHKLPRDWVDFVETGEISGALEAAFTNLEAEAAHSWQLAQQRMSEWLPKIFSFILIVIVALMIGRMMQAQELEQIDQVNKAIDGQ